MKKKLPDEFDFFTIIVMRYDIVPMLYHIILYLYRRASGCRTEIRIKNYDHQQRRRRFVECAAREGKNEYRIILYSNILILLCEIVLPIIMLKCRMLIIIIRSSSSSIHL